MGAHFDCKLVAFVWGALAPNQFVYKRLGMAQCSIQSTLSLSSVKYTISICLSRIYPAVYSNMAFKVRNLLVEELQCVKCACMRLKKTNGNLLDNFDFD